MGAGTTQKNEGEYMGRHNTGRDDSNWCTFSGLCENPVHWKLLKCLRVTLAKTSNTGGYQT